METLNPAMTTSLSRDNNVQCLPLRIREENGILTVALLRAPHCHHGRRAREKIGRGDCIARRRMCHHGNHIVTLNQRMEQLSQRSHCDWGKKNKSK
ncbi:hypothetical protein SESBI_25639 [Sesbania bispinosa]|nr:hypothetical protein SESBI_25639 [Sesbania bispinosa]